tara:strand:+ start:79 stop:489 length:411 start_codon:yes stop_codon:yes gene_type:complete
MGGNASDAIERLKPRSVKGVDMQNFGEGMAHNYRQLDAGLGQDSSFNKGLNYLTQGAADAISHGIGQVSDILNRSDLNAGNWQKGGDNKQEAQTASANYTGQAQTQRSGSGKRSSGKLTSDNKKSGKGKRALTIQK